jgi:formylmethanofuran dehydrogenase subunit E
LRVRVGEPFELSLPRKVESFPGFICDHCGEMTVEGYGRPLGGKKVCVPCYEKTPRER